jgi:hypothetical protein
LRGGSLGGGLWPHSYIVKKGLHLLHGNWESLYLYNKLYNIYIIKKLAIQLREKYKQTLR